MVLAASQAMCGEVRAVFGALRDVHLDVGAMLPPGRPTGSTSHHRPAALREHQTAPRCSRAWRTLQLCAMENTVLTMSFVHTGRQRRNGRIDKGDGLEVPRQLEAGQRQDVRARGSMCSEGKWD